MSAAAVLRSAGAACRALRPTAARFRRILDANKEQPFSPRETIITPRRHYSGGGVNTKEEVINIGAVRRSCRVPVLDLRLLNLPIESGVTQL
jgi:hypothetical protein